MLEVSWMKIRIENHIHNSSWKKEIQRGNKEYDDAKEWQEDGSDFSRNLKQHCQWEYNLNLIKMKEDTSFKKQATTGNEIRSHTDRNSKTIPLSKLLYSK